MSYDAFTTGYLEAMAWTEQDQPGFMEASFSDSLLTRAAADCARFQKEARIYLGIADALMYSRARAGHDFWLTRNGHGAGFWDRKELEPGKIGDALTAIAKSYGTLDCYLGDNGEIFT